MTAASARPPLRPRGEVRRLLLDAAQRLFAERGYSGTSTRAIAEAAGVANSLLHRHFAGKAQLFEEAVAEPFASYIAQVVADWEERSPLQRTLEEECRFFVAGLYDALNENRRLVLAMLAGDVYEDDLQVDQQDAPLARLLARLEYVTETEIRGHGLEPVGDVSAAVRLTFGMVLSAAVLPRWLVPGPPGSPELSRQQVISEIVGFMLHGIAQRPLG